MQGQIYDTINGNVYGVPIGRGANILQYNSEVVTETPTSWDIVWEADSPYAGQITAYDAPIYIADAAVYLMYHQPELGIQNPYALDETQLAAAGRTCSSSRTASSPRSPTAHRELRLPRHTRG